VGTLSDKFITKLSDGAFGSDTGLWNIKGALNSVVDDIILVNKIFPAGSALTVIVETSMFAGFAIPVDHQGVVGFSYTPSNKILILLIEINYVPMI
jgi:hypothetical protein